MKTNENFILREGDIIEGMIEIHRNGEIQFTLQKNLRVMYKVNCYDINDLKFVLRRLLPSIIDELKYRDVCEEILEGSRQKEGDKK